MELHGFGHLLLAGTWVTLQLAFTSLVFGLLLGLVGAAAALSPIGPLRWAAVGYNTLMRGIPELLLVLIIYFGATHVIEWMTGAYVDIGAFTAGVIALSIAFGAYATEVFRSAMLEIPKGQREAAMALGMSRWDSFRYITLPQLWRLALPGLGNLFLVLLKDTALVSIIGLDDLMRQAYVAAGFTKLPFTFYMAAAMIYLLLTIVSMQVIQLLERWANRGYRGARA
ncbi:MAG TPA: ABC transporter permease subunit [Azoarcus taiwanensis]|uniref:ABC transporter permease subunit n=1 Tax=Azoarcus taiwanensis TaxID=666964 RepID=A0A972F6U2_9RHOO|nr:ABC transporter permease subunit [Azoarcus taiwanensis]NMG02563.1 ABC transporter permease subunit [Azoarcus taiwanensis]HRQ55913.1 ABC transporter permease subunit [Azoarcus taiwanensis]